MRVVLHIPHVHTHANAFHVYIAVKVLRYNNMPLYMVKEYIRKRYGKNKVGVGKVQGIRLA